jgi:hypothetical protein
MYKAATADTTTRARNTQILAVCAVDLIADPDAGGAPAKRAQPLALRLHLFSA